MKKVQWYALLSLLVVISGALKIILFVNERCQEMKHLWYGIAWIFMGSMSLGAWLVFDRWEKSKGK
jgi:hypothetical protein